MKVKLRSGDTLDHFIGSNLKGQSIELGNGPAVSPMESVLMSIAACSTIDIVLILEKMRQKVENIEVEVDGTRNEEHPKVFTEVTVKYILTGQIKTEKLEEAIRLSLDKYCSVSMMIAKTAKITSSYEIKNI